jgi:hypothetical protein
MKTLALLASLALGLSAVAATAKTPAANPAPSGTPSKGHPAAPAPAKPMAGAIANPGTPTIPLAVTPAPATPAPAKPGVTLDAYVADLADQVPLSKDEQTDIKTYYQADGTQMQAILNDPNLSPLQQQEHIDDMRDARDSKIDALLQDADRQAKFREVESTYRVALVELAAEGGLVPQGTPPNVPEPTGTTPAQAERTPPGATDADAAPR